MLQRGSIYRPAEKNRSLSTTVQSFLFYKLTLLQPSKKFVLVLTILLLVAALFWFENHNTQKTSFNLAAQPQSSKTNANLNGQLNVPSASSKDQIDTSQSSSSSDSNISSADSTTSTNQTDVTVNGQSVSATTDDTHPHVSVNKTINTNDSSAHISIQSNVSKDSSGHSNSFQSTHVHSNSSGNSNVNVNINQQSSGGN